MTPFLILVALECWEHDHWHVQSDTFDRAVEWCQNVEGLLREIFPGVEWEVTLKRSGSSFAYADSIGGVPESFRVSFSLSPAASGKVYRQLCVDVPGSEVAAAQTDSHLRAVLHKYCDQFAAWLRSPSALKPSTRTNYSARFLNATVSSDSPLCVHNEKTGETIEYLTEGEALAAYFLLSHAPGTVADDLNILRWNSGNWVILAPEGLLRRPAAT